jgi:hypothetical protein
VRNSNKVSWSLLVLLIRPVDVQCHADMAYVTHSSTRDTPQPAPRNRAQPTRGLFSCSRMYTPYGWHRSWKQALTIYSRRASITHPRVTRPGIPFNLPPPRSHSQTYVRCRRWNETQDKNINRLLSSQTSPCLTRRFPCKQMYIYCWDFWKCFTKRHSHAFFF